LCGIRIFSVNAWQRYFKQSVGAPVIELADRSKTSMRAAALSLIQA